MSKGKIINILLAFGLVMTASGIACAQGVPLADSLAFAGSYEPEMRPTLYYTEGVKLAAEEREGEALNWFLLALSLDAEHAPSLYEAANVLAARGEIEKALEYSRRAADIDPENIWYRGQKARLLVSAGQYAEALPIFESMLGRSHMFEPDNYRILAALYYQQGMVDKALATLDSAEVRLGQNPVLVDIKRSMLIESGKVDEAVALTESFVRDNPYDEANRLVLADLYSHFERDSMSVAMLREVLEINPSNLAALVGMADHYLETGSPALFFSTVKQLFLLDEVPLKDKTDYFNTLVRNWSFSRQHFNEMSNLALILVTRYPGNPEVMELYSGHLIRSGDIEGALRMLKTMLDQPDPPLSAFMHVIELEAHLQRPDSIARYNALALRHYPREQDLYLQRSWVMQNLGREKEARRALDKAFRVAETDEERSNALGSLGTLWYQLGNTKKTYQNYDKALKYNPNNDHVLNNYAYFLSVEGKHLDRAFEMASRATGLVENSATYLDTYGWVLYKLGRYAEAKKVMQQALPLDGAGSSELLFHYGEILYALGDNFMASVYWKRALDAGYQPASDIEERLSRIKQ